MLSSIGAVPRVANASPADRGVVKPDAKSSTPASTPVAPWRFKSTVGVLSQSQALEYHGWSALDGNAVGAEEAFPPKAAKGSVDMGIGCPVPSEPIGDGVCACPPKAEKGSLAGAGAPESACPPNAPNGSLPAGIGCGAAGAGAESARPPNAANGSVIHYNPVIGGALLVPPILPPSSGSPKLSVAGA